MTNLYDFLRRVLNDATGTPPYSVNISQEEISWLKQFLAMPDNQIHFKARKIGENNGEPVYAQDYAIAGQSVDIFCLLSEAMMQNGTFADLVIKATHFFLEHVPNCPICLEAVNKARQGNQDWNFSPHKPLTNEQTRN